MVEVQGRALRQCEQAYFQQRGTACMGVDSSAQGSSPVRHSCGASALSMDACKDSRQHLSHTSAQHSWEGEELRTHRSTAKEYLRLSHTQLVSMHAVCSMWMRCNAVTCRFELKACPWKMQAG